MAKADETKRNPSSDLDDDIFAILNSTRPTYPGGGPNEQKPATQLNRRAVSQPNQPTQPQTSRPTQQTPVRPAAVPQQQPTPTQAVPPVSNPTAAPQPEQPPVQQPQPRQVISHAATAEDAWRPVVQPNRPQQSAASEEPLPRLQKRPVVSHAMPEQEDRDLEESWPDVDTLEEIPDEPPQEERRRIPKGRKTLAIIIAVYALILVAGFAARFIINAVQKHNQSDDASSSVSSSSQVDDSSTPDATAAETTEKAAAGDAEIVSITPDETYLAVLEDGTATIKVSLSAHGAANGSSLQWTSSDENIATVDENGAVKGVAAGTCTISVSAKNDPSVSADVDVAVRHLEEKDGCTYVDGILIVNKTYSLPESYDPAGLTDETQAALDKMIEDAYAAGLNLYDASDYRSYPDQLSVYQEYCARDGWEQADTYSARPGHSEHQTGMVIDFNDINSDFDDTAEAQWLAENCANYGFIVRFLKGKESITGYKYESWHVRYVGVETAKEIMSRGICLEEYLGVDSEYKNTWPEDPCNPESGVSEQ